MQLIPPLISPPVELRSFSTEDEKAKRRRRRREKKEKKKQKKLEKKDKSRDLEKPQEQKRFAEKLTNAEVMHFLSGSHPLPFAH